MRPPRAAMGPLQNCVSNEAAFQTDPRHALLPVQFFVDYFQRVKPLPRHIVASAIMAPTEPFSVAIDQQTTFPVLQHSCGSSNGVFGDPAQ